jgi:thioredoxin-like negative regulator of GroEL
MAGGEGVERPRLLFFCSARDGHSRRVEGFLAQVLQRRRNHDAFQVTRIEVQERPDLVERLRVTSSPTLFVVEGKRVKARLERPRGCEQIQIALQLTALHALSGAEEPGRRARGCGATVLSVS